MFTSIKIAGQCTYLLIVNKNKYFKTYYRLTFEQGTHIPNKKGTNSRELSKTYFQIKQWKPTKYDEEEKRYQESTYKET